MHNYLVDTEFAAKTLISLIADEDLLLSSLRKELVDLQVQYEEATKFLYGIARSYESYEDYDDRKLQYYYMQSFKAGEPYQQKIDELKPAIENREISLAAKNSSLVALSGALLQIAKQGISLIYGPRRSACVEGRYVVASECLRNIIWEGRNQSMHYETNTNITDYHGPVRDCFSNLESALGADFSLSTNPTKNFARDIVKLLGWESYENYVKDLESLLIVLV